MLEEWESSVVDGDSADSVVVLSFVDVEESFLKVDAVALDGEQLTGANTGIDQHQDKLNVLIVGSPAPERIDLRFGKAVVLIALGRFADVQILDDVLIPADDLVLNGVVKDLIEHDFQLFQRGVILAGVVYDVLKVRQLQIAEADVVYRRAKLICRFVAGNIGVADLVKFAVSPAVIYFGEGDLGRGLKGIGIVIGKSLEGGLSGLIVANGLVDLPFLLCIGVDLPACGDTDTPRSSASAAQLGDTTISVWQLHSNSSFLM